MTTDARFRSDVPNQWCPGCPNFGILTAMQQALVELEKQPEEVCLVSGIGQAAKFPHYVRAHVFNGLHGRALPAATGIAVANPGLTTIVTSGDGDLYGEGGNHFLHTLRRNPDFTVVIHNNQIYALTKGQASPTTPRCERTRLQIEGVEVDPARMLATAIAHDCTFVARGFAGEIQELSGLLRVAIAHRGLSIVEVIQACITWGNHSVDWYREKLAPVGEDHDPTDRARAIELALQAPETWATGILYRTVPRPVFGESHFRRTGVRTRIDEGAIDRADLETELKRRIVS